MDLTDIEAARRKIAGQVVLTPCTHSATLSALTGVEVFLKFENQQFTASFKERGALNFLLSMPREQRERGVIAMSAGNHAQALAYHGSRLGIPTLIVMPRNTPNTKVEQTSVFGAEVLLHGKNFDETLRHTEELATERGLTLVHPFDDPLVMAGQGTIGLEVLEQVPDVDIIVVPVGGGGLISGVAAAAKAKRPEVSVVGAQAERYPGAHAAFYARPAAESGAATVAEGIAVKSPGAHTLPVMRRLVDDIVLVSEEAIEGAIFTLLEIEKTLTEGAGAVGLAAVSADPQRFAGKRTVLVLSGGNMDMMVLSSVLQRGLVRSHRLVRLEVEIPDVPGALAELTHLAGQLDSNIVEIQHQRAFGSSSARAVIVEMVLQMRGEEQVEEVHRALVAHGYAATIVE